MNAGRTFWKRRKAFQTIGACGWRSRHFTLFSGTSSSTEVEAIDISRIVNIWPLLSGTEGDG